MGSRPFQIGISTTLLVLMATSSAVAQRRPARPQPPAAASRAGEPAPQVTQAPVPPTAPVSEGVPSEAVLGVPVYPTAVYLTAYDAGRGQTYYIFGSNAPFEEMVQYYETVLDEDGDRVFNAPPVHMFETGRFREERMAFQPSVTVKDYTWNGSPGYLNPTPGAAERYPTVIQIVPTPLDQRDR